MTDLLKLVRCPRCGALVEVYPTGLKWNPSDAELCEEKLIENCPHLKRAIERFLVHPLSNLMATSQVSAGDWIQADFDPERNCLLFTKEAEALEIHAMASMIGENFRMPPVAAAMVSQPDLAKTVSAGKSSKK